MTGWRKRTIMEMAREAGILEPIDLLDFNQWRQDTIRELEAFAALVREDECARLADHTEDNLKMVVHVPMAHIVGEIDNAGKVWTPAQPAPYMAVSTDRMSVDPHTGNVSIGTVAQPEERNFCPRCGKRTRDLTTIHTCTPPQ
jgi:hypothetical protein